MERNTAFFKELLIRKAMDQPASTSSKNPKGKSEQDGTKQDFLKTDVPIQMLPFDGFY